MRKTKIYPYIGKETREAMKLYALRLRISESDLVDQALIQFMAPDNAEAREKAMLRKWDNINQTLKTVKRDGEITAELLSMFVRLYLSCTTELPDSEKEAARRAGGARFQKFQALMIERLRQNKLFSEELIGAVTTVEDGFEEMEIAVEEEVA